MISLFEYNWQVRRDWFSWCDKVDPDELLKKRTGGLGYILPTLYHIVAVEYGWIVIDFSTRCHDEVEPFVYGWNDSMENRVMIDITDDGKEEAHKMRRSDEACYCARDSSHGSIVRVGTRARKGTG